LLQRLMQFQKREFASIHIGHLSVAEESGNVAACASFRSSGLATDTGGKSDRVQKQVEQPNFNRARR